MGAFCARRSRGFIGWHFNSSAKSSGARIRAAALVGATLFAVAPAIASETISYTYDARGRLVKVAHSGTVNNGASACYSYDKADNRSNVNVSTSSACTSGGGGGTTAPSFAVNNVSATEGSNLVFTVTKSGTTSTSYSVNYATANGTAVAGFDYTSKSGTLTFSSSQTSLTVSVATTDDTTVENAETLYLNLSGASGGATISDSQGVGTINDNDSSTNQPPVANFDNAGSMTCGDVMTYNVVANDTDPDGNYPLSLVSASGSAGIMVSVANSTDIQILSTGTSSGTKSFSYVVQDSLGAQATGSGSVTVTAPCQ